MTMVPRRYHRQGSFEYMASERASGGRQPVWWDCIVDICPPLVLMSLRGNFSTSVYQLAYAWAFQVSVYCVATRKLPPPRLTLHRNFYNHFRINITRVSGFVWYFRRRSLVVYARDRQFRKENGFRNTHTGGGSLNFSVPLIRPSKALALFRRAVRPTRQLMTSCLPNLDSFTFKLWHPLVLHLFSSGMLVGRALFSVRARNKCPCGRLLGQTFRYPISHMYCSLS